MKDISIIIVSWNTKEILRQCLRSVYEHTPELEIETIVVDNASSDGSAEMVLSDFPQVVLIENNDNRGFAAANNQGMSLATGRYFLLLNSDTIILKNAIEKCVDFADRNTDAAVVGCRVLNADRSLQPTCFMFPSILNMFLSASYLYKIFPQTRFFGREKMTWWQRDSVEEVDVVTGCFMLVRKAAIDQIGQLDEQFFMYAEETDWCYRFKKTGWKILFTPDAEIIHLGGQSSKKVREKMVIQLRLSILDFMKKHRSRFEYRTASLLVFAFFALRVPYWAVKGMKNGISRAKCQAYLKASVYVLFPDRFKVKA